MKINQKIIKLEADISEYDDFFLIGILSTFEDYQLAFQLNRLLGLNLEKDDDYIANNHSFSMFCSQNEIENIEVKLLENKINMTNETAQDFGIFSIKTVEQKFVFPELNKIDFLLKVSYENKNKTNKYIDKLQKTNFINTVVKIDLKSIKIKRNLLF